MGGGGVGRGKEGKRLPGPTSGEGSPLDKALHAAALQEGATQARKRTENQSKPNKSKHPLLASPGEQINGRPSERDDGKAERSGAEKAENGGENGEGA